MSWAGWGDYAPPDPAKPRTVSAKRHKYQAQAHYVAGPGAMPMPVTKLDPIPDGAPVFPSKREAERFVVLFAQQSAQEITGLELQPQFALHVVRSDGVKVCIGRYIADFAYERDGQRVCEDSKGFRTPLYEWKRRHVEAEYGVQIVEV